MKNKKKNKLCDDVEVFVDEFTDGLTVGFKSGCPYSDVSKTLTELSMDVQMDIFCR